jgi:hypothetical protein
MTKLAGTKFVVLFLIVSTVHGQKIKYKDIWGLLSTKQYEQAEPFLKRYLLEEKNDNPNALLYMGIIFHEKSMKSDVLKQTEHTISAIDSAVLYYDLAYKNITEKELKRNDEYYQAYNRRDLRTGEFGVKLSDIQFDLEKKMQGLRERIDRVKMVKYYFVLADSLYKKSNALFKTIQQAYPSEKAMYLRADEPTVASLNALAVRFDSCTKAFDLYKSSTATLGHTGYSQQVKLKEIADFKVDGVSVADFYQDDLELWDYKKFATRGKQIIEAEILPMREHLVTYDIEINKLRTKLNTDSISVKSDLTSLIDRLLMEQMRKFDPEPLPIEVFTLKIADLEYRSTVLEHHRDPDTIDVHRQLARVNSEMKYLNKLDSMATKLSADNFDQRATDYEYFVTNTFSSKAVLKSYIHGLKDYASKEKQRKEAELAMRSESLRWLINGSDSIPLFRDDSQSRFKPLTIVEEKYTAGLQYEGSLRPSGYLYSINATRIPAVKAVFPVDSTCFKFDRLSSAGAITYSDESGQIYFVLIYSDRRDDGEQFAATLAKVYRSDGLSWSMNYKLNFVPKEIAFDAGSGELAIRGEGNQQNTMDKNGKEVPK